jgi:ABC-type nitrate/sulfonate/bicarbonate transport system substrate-binding protein
MRRLWKNYRDVVVILRKKVLLLLLLGVSSIIITACSTSSKTSSSSSVVPSSHLISMQVGTLTSTDAVPIWLGVDRGFFKQHGLLLKYLNISSGAAIVPALESGSIQLAQFATTVFMTATARGIPLRSIAEVDHLSSKTTGFSILVKNTSGINSISQLKNKVIAVNATNSFETLALEQEVLPAAHLTQSQVRIVPIPWPDMKEALLTGEVQAVIPYDPFTAEIEQTPGVKVLARMRDYFPKGGLALGVVAGMDSYVSSHPAVIKAFRAGLAESIAYIENHPRQAAVVVSNVLKIPQTTTLKSLSSFELDPKGKLDLMALNNVVTLLKNSNLVPSSYNPSLYLYNK